MAATITAAAVPIKFDDGTEYLFAPLSDGDVQELDLWAQSRAFQVARASGLTDQDAMKAAMNIDWANTTRTIMGIERMLYYSLRREQQDITHDECYKHLRSGKNVREIWAAFYNVNMYGKNSRDSNSNGNGGGRDTHPLKSDGAST